MTRSKARITGAVYLLYFLTAILAVSSIGRVPEAYSDAANLIANAGYVGVTLLLYRIFKPVSRIFGLFNLTIGYLILRSTFLPRALGVLMALSGI